MMFGDAPNILVAPKHKEKAILYLNEHRARIALPRSTKRACYTRLVLTRMDFGVSKNSKSCAGPDRALSAVLLGVNPSS